MTDQVPSGDSAATNETPSAQPDAGSFGTFGAKRGSGLARGKRSSTPAASAAPAAPSGEYRPTALELITPQREYQNPFGGENTVAAPAAVEAPVPPIESPAPATPAPYVAPEPIPAQREYITEQAAEVIPEPKMAVDESAPVKAELNILPPAETKRAATSWESRDDRPVFRTDAQRAREGREGDPRRERREPSRGGPEGQRSFNGPRSDAPRSPDAPRPAEGQRPEGGPRPEGYRSEGQRSDGRRRFEESRGEGHRSSESSSRSAPEAARPKGFIAWLKGLFSSKPADPIPDRSSERPSGEQRGEHDRGGDGHRRRRHRGGRGRHGESRGEYRSEDRGAPRAEGSSETPGEGQSQHQGGHRGEYRGGEGQGGHGGRRRHRGGRGRSRGEGGGGDRGDRGPRPEGQQGGGYI